MSKRKRGNESSLELLLDTICNTFGGVLFVALLIVVMLRMTARTATESDTAQVSEAEQLELERQDAALQGVIETLRAAGSALGDSVALSQIDTADEFEQLKRQQRTRQELLQSRLGILDRITKRQTRINQAVREIAKSEKEEQATIKRRRDLETALKAEAAVRSQQADYSRTHDTGKQEIQAIVRYGRFYVWHHYGPSGSWLGLNTDEFVVLEDSANRILTTPMPHAGTILVDTPQAGEQLTARLKRFDPKRQYVGVIVWPDSFETFRLLKKVLIQNGFEYRLVPAKPGDAFSDRGGSTDGVQ